MSDNINPVQGTSQSASKLHAQMQEAKNAARTLNAEQVASVQEFSEWVDTFAFTPTLMMKRFKELDEKLGKKDIKKDETKKEDEVSTEAIQDISEISQESSDVNPELNKRSLESLRASITEDDDPHAVMQKALESYPDQYLADEALDYLVRTTPEDSPLMRKLADAKSELNDTYAREIKAGRNMSTEARLFSEKGLGSPTALRDLYKSITGNPKPPAELFDELSKKFNFNDLSKLIKFIMHSLGADMKASGPSIPNQLLTRLFAETRTMQAILGVYRFFNARTGSIASQFHRNDLDMPPRLNYELLAKQFVKMITERYPSSDKILKLGVLLGIADEELAQIIIFTQYRDAIRGVSPRLFKSEKHRQDVLLALLDTLSELEDLLDDEDEEDEDE